MRKVKNYWEWKPVFQLKPQETALLVIDMQKGFLDEGAPLEVPMARQQAPDLAELIAYCRSKSVPVIYTAFTVCPDYNYSFYWKMAEQRGLKVEYPDCAFWEGKPETEIASVLQPLPGEIVLNKCGYDCFARTELDQILRDMGVKTLLISGTVVNWCVDSTVRAAYHKDYHVAVVADAVSSFDHAGATAEDWCKLELNLFAEAFGRVLTTKEIMNELNESNENEREQCVKVS